MTGHLRAPAKAFDVRLHRPLIDSLEANMPTRQFEAASEPIVLDILANCEGFSHLERAPQVGGVPFDYFGHRNGKPYVVEYKGSRSRFPGLAETQRRRLQELHELLPALGMALLQVNLAVGRYRMSYDSDVERLFAAEHRSLAPVVEWLKERICEIRQGCSSESPRSPRR